VGVDCISADVGLDATVDAVVVRTEQLSKREFSAVTDQKSQVYALKRNLKTMKQQLDGKVRLSPRSETKMLGMETKSIRPRWRWVRDRSCCLVAQRLGRWIRDREVASSTPGGCVPE